MNSVFLLDDGLDIENCDVQVYLPGPPGPPIVDVATRLLPIFITLSIAAPVNRRQRSFISGNAAPINNPTIPNPSDNGPWELYLFTTDDTNTITLDNQVNLQLSGQWIGKSGSILYLQWDGVSQYVEGGRNEI